MTNILRWAAVVLMLCLVGQTQAFERTESRDPCKRVVPTKIPLFGDTHVHTRYSLDASTQDTVSYTHLTLPTTPYV